MHRGVHNDDLGVRIHEYALAAHAQQREVALARVDQPGLVAVAVEFRRDADLEMVPPRPSCV